MTARLRELAERWNNHFQHGGAIEYVQCANELRAILDADGDSVPARSGGVSDADVDAACRVYIAADRFLLDGAVESMREPMRAALTHFAKGERHD